MSPSNQTPREKEDEGQEKSLPEKDEDVDVGNGFLDDGERDSPEKGGHQKERDGPELFHPAGLSEFRCCKGFQTFIQTFRR